MSSASVRDQAVGEVISRIGPGLLVLVGVTHDDGAPEVDRIAAKIWNLRILRGDGGSMEVSLAGMEERGGPASLLVVSQFTLYGDTRKGRRPSFTAAARPEKAEELIDAFVDRLRELGADVATGRFGADMAVELVNDGPVTLMVQT